MIVLDENILDGQRLLLEASRVVAGQIGVDIGRKGMKDDEIVVLLRQQRNITFFTRDAGFYLPKLRHRRYCRRYCLVVMSVGQNEVATFVRRFLRHPDFDTQVKRMGRGSTDLACRSGGMAVAFADRDSHRLEPLQMVLARV